MPTSEQQARRLARIAGVWFVITFAASIPAVLLYDPLLNDANYVPGSGADTHWTFLLGPSFCAGFGNGLLLGYLMYRSGLVPRRMALIGLIGGPLCFAASVGVLFGLYEDGTGVKFALTFPEIVWEASLGIYLIAKGFRASPGFFGHTDRALAPAVSAS